MAKNNEVFPDNLKVNFPSSVQILSKQSSCFTRSDNLENSFITSGRYVLKAKNFTVIFLMVSVVCEEGAVFYRYIPHLKTLIAHYRYELTRNPGL